MRWTTSTARLHAIATCGVLLALPSLASAETGLTERLRVQGIYAHQAAAMPPDDLAAQAVPELSLLAFEKRSQMRLTYTLAATAHTTLPADLSNRLALSSSFELSKRTTLLLSAEAGHTSVANALVTRQPSDAPVGTIPQSAGQLVTTRLSEGTSWEASRVVRIGQVVDLSYITSVDAPLRSQGYLASAVVSYDRTWPSDALGIDFRGAYSWTHSEPLLAQRLVPLALTPHWRHDISRTLTSFIAAGPSIVLSPDGGSALIGPVALATLSYFLDDATLALSGSVGPQPNGLTAQLLYAEQVTLRAAMPLSVEHAVGVTGAVGYTHGTIIDRQVGAVQQPDFDTLIADAGIGWSPAVGIELFARYQFLDQVNARAAAAAVVSTPATQRSTVILGVQLSSRPDPVRVPTRFPQRVDRGDAAPAPTPAP